MKKPKTYFSITQLLFLSFTAFAQQSTLDLTQPEQQKDFLKYLKTTISLLEDSSMKNKIKGYDLKNLTDSNKQEIAYFMMKDTSYFKRLNDYFAFMRILENKYRISQFSNKEWGEVAQFGAKNGIYFISAMKKLKEQKDALPHIPNYFPVTHLKKITDTVPSQSRKNHD
jgi:hypothetical protein